MLKNKFPGEKSTSLKFSVTQEKHARDLDMLSEQYEDANVEIKDLTAKLIALTDEVLLLKQQMKKLLATLSV